MSRIVRGIFGGRSSSERVLDRFTPASFRSPSGTGTFNRRTNTFNLTRSPEREAAISGVVSGFNERAQAISGLRPQVAPGFGRLSQIRGEGLRSRINEFRGRANATVGNIREQLARRRLAGSSFQSGEVARASAEFARQEDLIRAEAQEQEAQAFLQEITLSTELIREQFESSIAGLQTVLQELNFDTEVAASIATASSDLMQRNIQAQAEARAAQQAAGESFIDNILGIFG